MSLPSGDRTITMGSTMKRLLMSAVVAAAFVLPGASTPISASENPIFGNAKVATLSTDAAKKVTAKGGTMAYYIYYGMLYGSYAYQMAGYAQYLNWYGDSGRGSYAYSAYYYAQISAGYYYTAYLYQNY